jgi:hypothetical protein
MNRLALLGLAALVLGGCGSETDTTGTQAAPTSSAATTAPPPPTTEPPPTAATTTTAAAPEPLPGLPAWTAAYRDWVKLNKQPIPPKSPDPHLGTKNVYVSDEAVNGIYPIGAMIVKEAFRPDKDFVGLIATMRKIEGANPGVNDWVFVEWTRDAPGAPFTELARGGVCESCHSGVAGQDYVFTQG